MTCTVRRFRRCSATALVSASMAAVLSLVALSLGGTSGVAGATPVGSSTTTSVTSSTSTTVPNGGSTTTSTVVDPSASTTTSVPSLADDGLLGAPDSGSAEGSGYGGQFTFDAASRAILASAVADASLRLTKATDAVNSVQAVLAQIEVERSAIDAQLKKVRSGRSEQIGRASEQRSLLSKRIAAAFVRGDQSIALYSSLDNPSEFSRGRRYLEAIANNDQSAIRNYESAIEGLSAAEIAFTEQQSVIDSKAADQEAALALLKIEQSNAQLAVDAYSAGSHVFADGFVFPVLGPVNFIDSWGFPRLSGTSQAHWHEGTDIMAPIGRELVATENGYVFKIGDASLGGHRIWVHGDTGVEYYYAHLSAFAPGLTENQRVTAGTVIGYVGNSGDASGGPAHLHFEIHPGGGAAVNPFPLLKAAYGPGPMPSQSEALSGPSRVRG